MSSLEEIDPYTSYRLHWFPYEITQCSKLEESRVSTRALYGNYKNRPPFPDLKSTENMAALELRTPLEYSVCRKPMRKDEVNRYWISLKVATDVLPLLINACSEACISALPNPPAGYIGHAHTGGVDIKQPAQR